MRQEREVLETKIAKQIKKVAALHELAQGEDDTPPLTNLIDGITDACRVVFRAFDKALLPIEVRDKVLGLGLPNQSNLLASIYTTIRRMKEAGEIIEVFESQPGSSSAVAAYKWAGETVPARLRRLVTETDAVPQHMKLRPQERSQVAHTKPTSKK